MSLRIATRAVLCILVLTGCQRFGCGDAASVAELLEAHGRVERDHAAHVGAWEPSQIGDEFARGDGLRTAKDATAVVRVGKRARARVESATTIRFLAQGEGADPAKPNAAPATLDIEQGAAVVDVGDEDLAITTRAGRAVLKRGAQVAMQATDGGATRYRVLVGGATFTQANGRGVDVGAGESISVGIGLAVLDPVDAPKPSSPPTAAGSKVAAADAPAPAASPGADAGTSAAALEAQNTQAEAVATPAEQAADVARTRADQADLSVPAGESFRIYDPRPPTLVAVQISGRCPALGELGIPGRPSVRGRSAILVELGPGIHAYSIRCVDDAGVVASKPVARGVARVLRSSSVRPLAKTAPRNSVDLDGRRYTLMYQNLRPIVAVAWVDAPKAASYAFSVRTPDGKVSASRTHEPRFVVQSSMLLDGAHTFSMQTEGKPSQRSKETTVEIVFDNAAPTESIELPRPDGFSAGENVRVVGVARAGSRLSVNGHAIALDSAQRFASTVALTAGQRTLVLRFQHPDGGIRYHLRRAIGARR